MIKSKYWIPMLGFWLMPSKLHNDLERGYGYLYTARYHVWFGYQIAMMTCIPLLVLFLISLK